MSRTERGVALVTGAFLRHRAGDGPSAGARWLSGVRNQPEADGRHLNGVTMLGLRRHG